MSQSQNIAPNSGSQPYVSRNSFSIFSASAFQSTNDIKVLEFLLKTANATAEVTEHATSVRVADINASLSQGLTSADKRREQLISEADQALVGTIANFAQAATGLYSLGSQVHANKNADNMAKFANEAGKIKFNSVAQTGNPTVGAAVSGAGSSNEPNVTPLNSVNIRAAFQDGSPEQIKFSNARDTLLNFKKVGGPGLSREDWEAIIAKAPENDPLLATLPNSQVTLHDILNSADSESEHNDIKAAIGDGSKKLSEYASSEHVQRSRNWSEGINGSLNALVSVTQASLKCTIQADAIKDQAIADALAQTYSSALQLTQETINSMNKVNDSMASGAQQLLQTFGQTWGLDTQPVQG